MTTQPQILGIFDFENIEVSLRQKYSLSLTEAGVLKLVDAIKTFGTMENKYFLVAAYWDNFKNQKFIISKLGLKPIFVPIDIKNAADCSLIMEVMKLAISNTLEQFSDAFILAGDGGYASLTHYLHELGIKVHMLSIKNCTNTQLIELVDSHDWVENILEIENETTYNETYTLKITLRPEWKAVIVKVLNLSHMYVLHESYLIKQLVAASENLDILKPYNTFDKCKELVFECYSQGLLLRDKTSTLNGRTVNTTKINSENLLVQIIQKNS